MAIPSRGIGWGTESNLLWSISKQLEYLIKVTSQTSGGGTDKEFVVTVYTVINAFTGASVGDIITCTQVIDVTTNIPVTITTIWRNQTTATDLPGAPSFANLSLEGTTALTDAQLRASAVPVIANAGTDLNTSLLALENGGNLESIDNKLPTLSNNVPEPNSSALPTRVAGQNIETAGFEASGASVLDDMFVQTPIVGTGISYNQTNSSLNILTGTTPNSEFLARSTMSFKGSMRLRFNISASQRIVNNNLQVSLADLIGENLAFNIVSSTLVDVTLTAHSFTAVNIGQSMNIAGLGEVGIPNRYAIQSIPDANTIRFTVAGWPSSGTGTCTLFGYNQIKNLVTGILPTQMTFDSQRNGWAFGDTIGIINTTAGIGTMIANEITGRDVFLMDALKLSVVAPTFTTKASRYENIPEQTIPLYVFIWNFNGTVAPVSTTTFSLSSLSVENFANVPIYIQGFRANGQQNAQPVSVLSGLLNTINTVANITSANLGAPAPLADIASAALITTTTTAAITVAGISYSVNIPVTAVTGTNPTLDVTIQESDDTGINWFNVYTFPRITATGIYRSPIIPLKGNRIRYVQTVGGTSPSFTRSTNRLVMNISPINAVSQLIDRTVVLTTLNSVTPSLNVQNATNLQLVMNIGVTTIAPILQLEGSEDNGLTWYAIGTPLTAVASSTVQFTLATFMNAQLVRARVATAGTVTTMGYVLIKGF